MAIYYFTFGQNSEHAGKCQPIEAENGNIARAAMRQIYGNQWVRQYPPEIWENLRNSRCRWWELEDELPLIKAVRG